MVGLGVVAWIVSDNIGMGFVCAGALLLSSWRLWLPVTFELGTKGVCQSTWFYKWRIPWRCFARFETRPRGVWLLCDTSPSPFSTARGIFIGWSNQETQILAVLEFFLAARRHRAANTTRTYAS